MAKPRFVVGISKFTLPIFFYYVPKARYIIRHPEKFSTEDMYDFGIKVVNMLRISCRTKTEFFGLENLPEKGSYIMYANHQGKYDALGILLGHKRPLSILWAKKSSNHILVKEVSKLLRCVIIDLDSKTNFMPAIKTLAERAAAGDPFLIFPEGKYKNNKNELQEFQTGCFMASILSKTDVIPVVIYDSYKSMDTNKIFGRARTQVHYLEPIYYEEYKSLNRKELCVLVQQRIQEKLDELKAKDTKRT